jgi:glycosyltransferase involved in cell wall biosynthesis
MPDSESHVPESLWIPHGSKQSVGGYTSSGVLGTKGWDVCKTGASSARLSLGVLSSGQLSSGVLTERTSCEPSRRKRPLSVVHVGPCLFRGGAEQHLIDLARFLDPERARLTECLVIDGNAIDLAVARDLPCPARAATGEDITRALQTADIVLHWGLELDQYVCHDHQRKAISLYIAHGDSPWTQELLRRSAKSTDLAVAVSQRVYDTCCQEFPGTVILNGVDTSRLATTRSRRAVREALGFSTDDFVVGYVGRFSPEKRPELIIDALAQLPRRFKALFLGWGPMQAELLQNCNSRIPNRYAFRFADRNLGDYYQAFDAFALMSTMEGFALVFLEAMFSSLPVVATPVGAVPEVITSMVNGIIADRSGSDLAKHLTRLESNPEWAHGMGASARQYAMEHGHALRMAEEYMNLFEQLRCPSEEQA